MSETEGQYGERRADEGLGCSHTILSIQLEQGKGTTGRQVVDWSADSIVDEDDRNSH